MNIKNRINYLLQKYEEPQCSKQKQSFKEGMHSIDYYEAVHGTKQLYLDEFDAAIT